MNRINQGQLTRILVVNGKESGVSLDHWEEKSRRQAEPMMFFKQQ